VGVQKIKFWAANSCKKKNSVGVQSILG